jgi:hypothetical protein
MSIYAERAIVKTIDPRDGEPREVICEQEELTEVLRAALVADQTIREVLPFWSVADEQAAFESCPEEADCAFAM